MHTFVPAVGASLISMLKRLRCKMCEWCHCFEFASESTPTHPHLPTHSHKQGTTHTCAYALSTLTTHPTHTHTEYKLAAHVGNTPELWLRLARQRLSPPLPSRTTLFATDFFVFILYLCMRRDTTQIRSFSSDSSQAQATRTAVTCLRLKISIRDGCEGQKSKNDDQTVELLRTFPAPFPFAGKFGRRNDIILFTDLYPRAAIMPGDDTVGP